MRIETMVASEWHNFAAQVAESRQLFPLFETHSSAREVFTRSVRKNTGHAYVAYAGKVPYLFIMTESERVTNLLLLQETAKTGWSSIFTVIEHLFKRTFQGSVSFHFPHHLTLHLKELF